LVLAIANKEQTALANQNKSYLKQKSLFKKSNQEIHPKPIVATKFSK
jgi:hypothetical protein